MASYASWPFRASGLVTVQLLLSSADAVSRRWSAGEEGEVGGARSPHVAIFVGNGKVEFHKLKEPTPIFATVDLRTVRFLRFRQSCRLNFVVKFFNLFNRENLTQINPFYGSAPVPLSSFG